MEPPYTLTATLSNGETASITYEDFYLTPMDKYAKGSSIKLPKGATVATIFRRDSTLIDDSMVSYHVEPVEENKEESSASEVEDTEELDTRFSRFSPGSDTASSRADLLAQMVGADDIIDLFRKLSEALIFYKLLTVFSVV